ncbi:MAG: leucine-rich repeat protein [Oscillospiraceae bacterium]|nr:leucine-rich repeat protein [Oscillospiraceae bacterium]
MYHASMKGVFYMNWWKKAAAAATAACTMIGAVPQGIVPASASDGVFRVTVDQVTVDRKDIQQPVPIYIRTSSMPKGWTDYEFGIEVDPRCTYSVAEDSDKALKLGGAPLDRLPTIMPLSGNQMWLTDSSARSLTSSMNIALLMVTVPADAKAGDRYAIKVNTKTPAGEEAAWCKNMLYSLDYDVEGVDGCILILDDAAPTETTAPTEPTERPTDPTEPPTDPTEQTATGTCGEHLTWTLTPDGTLTISGTGEMADRPDFGDKSKIKSIVIGEGVTSIGTFAFVKSQNLTSVTLPDSLTTISGYAFQSCTSLTSLTIPAGVTSIGSMIFFHCTEPPVIYGYDGTTAQNYAALNGYPFELLPNTAPGGSSNADPTEAPTTETTEKPTEAPIEKPTTAPTEKPTEAPTEKPTTKPTEKPTEAPTEKPTEAPTEKPTTAPTEKPTEAPTEQPTTAPPALLLGDTDGSGSLSVSDIIALQKYLLGVGELKNSDVADLNGDSVIDIFDLGLLKRLMLAKK